jgi:hypothetical protein
LTLRQPITRWTVASAPRRLGVEDHVRVEHGRRVSDPEPLLARKPMPSHAKALAMSSVCLLAFGTSIVLEDQIRSLPETATVTAPGPQLRPGLGRAVSLRSRYR